MATTTRFPTRAPSASPLVGLTRQHGYDLPGVQAAVERVLEPLGGPTALFRPGSRVLVKPNLLTSHSLSALTCTDPVLLEAVLNLLVRAGAKPRVGDSPALESCTRVMERQGLMDVVRRTGVEVASFEEEVDVENGAPGARYRRLSVARDAVEADAVLNLARMKTHGQMTVTFAVKNLFGCVVGTKKAQWHLRAGADRSAFAALLLDLHSAIAPTVSLVDGIVAMEGNGPAAGRAVAHGFLGASENAVALDAVLTRMAGSEPRQAPTVREAMARGLPGADVAACRTQWVGPDPLEQARLAPAFHVTLAWIPGRWAQGLVRKTFAPSPVVDARECVRCGQCERVCPVHAIAMAEAAARIDLTPCIRCFCCQEICPQGAISIRPGWGARLFDAVARVYARIRR